MPTLEQVMEQAKKLTGAEQYFGRRELKELPNILGETETIEGLLQGIYAGRQGLLVATDCRLLFVDKGMFGGLRVEDFPYSKISSIQYELGILLGKVTVFASGNKAVVEQTFKAHTQAFVEVVRRHISGVEKPTTPAPASQDDPLAKLERLGKLKEQGLLTEDEFLAQKAKLLAAM